MKDRAPDNKSCAFADIKDIEGVHIQSYQKHVLHVGEITLFTGPLAMLQVLSGSIYSPGKAPYPLRYHPHYVGRSSADSSSGGGGAVALRNRSVLGRSLTNMQREAAPSDTSIHSHTSCHTAAKHQRITVSI